MAESNHQLNVIHHRIHRMAPLLLFLTLMCTSACRETHSHNVTAPSIKVSPEADSDHDGIPNNAELSSYEDREYFRRWFTAIAETQFSERSREWNVDQRDCAGLVRFAWREALRRHDRAWLQRMGPGYRIISPDIKAYNLENCPLGEKIFRTEFGAYKADDLANGRFSEFADAKTLKNYNCTFVSRDPGLAEPGDLLFFHQPWVQSYPYHVMIFLGPSQVGEGEASDWVVYHTGSSPRDKGEVKKVRLSILCHHPNPRWRPVLENPHFLGFFRLKILDQNE